MTVLKFRPRTHPQQTRAGRGDPSKDERYTLLEDFEPIHQAWRFTLDVAGCEAAPVSRLIGRWYDKAANGLIQPWDGEVFWGNVPFSNIWEWVVKAWASKAKGCILIPANRTEQEGWQTLVEPYRDQLDGVLRTRFLRGHSTSRNKFGTPDDPDGRKWKSSPPFGCVLLQWMTPRRPSWAPVG